MFSHGRTYRRRCHTSVNISISLITLFYLPHSPSKTGQISDARNTTMYYICHSEQHNETEMCSSCSNHTQLNFRLNISQEREKYLSGWVPPYESGQACRTALIMFWVKQSDTAWQNKTRGGVNSFIMQAIWTVRRNLLYMHRMPTVLQANIQTYTADIDSKILNAHSQIHK